MPNARPSATPKRPQMPRRKLPSPRLLPRPSSQSLQPTLAPTSRGTSTARSAGPPGGTTCVPASLFVRSSPADSRFTGRRPGVDLLRLVRRLAAPAMPPAGGRARRPRHPVRGRGVQVDLRPLQGHATTATAPSEAARRLASAARLPAAPTRARHRSEAQVVCRRQERDLAAGRREKAQGRQGALAAFARSYLLPD